MIATNDLDSPRTATAHKPPHPCDACKRSKLKCDQRRPICETCQKRDKVCNYSTADGYTDGRVRKFHRRSRNGCSHCKARRVRCDEVKPVCGGCRRKGTVELCIFPPDTGRSSHSKSPSPPPAQPAFTIDAPPDSALPNGNGSAQASTAINASNVPGGDANTANAAIPADYFSQPMAPLLGHQTMDLMEPSTANALSLWNGPNSFGTIASPSTLLASLFGNQSTDMFPSSGVYDFDPLKTQPQTQAIDLSLGPNDGSLDLNSSITNVSTLEAESPGPQFFDFNGFIGRADRNISASAFGVPPTGTANLKDLDPFSIEAAGSSDSTPISLNGNNASFADFTNYIRPEYRNRPEHPAYLYQLQMLDHPDQLAPYFPSLEQRHQFRHFFLETSKSLLVTPTAPASNPFLCHFGHFALGAPAGQSLTHDAFRFALLSLASLDIGIKMSMAMPGMQQNAMYATSEEQRSEAHKRLIAASISGFLKDDPADAELAIATTVALSIRDRLAGCQEWEPPLKIGRDVVVDCGGPEAFINARPTADRRFLVEQMAVLELIGYLTIWVSPKLLGWENAWLQNGSYAASEDAGDHLEIVYGWTREVIVYAARAMTLCGEARDIEAMREAQPKPGYRRLKEIIDVRMASLIKRVKHFLPQGEIVKANIMTSLYPPEVLVGVLGVQACMDLCLRTVILMEDIKSEQVQALVRSILDMSDESIARGRYPGLLLPLSWADGVAYGPELKSRAKTTLGKLRHHYHLNQELLERIINIDWASLNNIGLGDWEAFLRKHGYYVPCF